jgi:hypothetical protein
MVKYFRRFSSPSLASGALASLIASGYNFDDDSAALALERAEYAHYPTAPKALWLATEDYLSIRAELVAIAARAQGNSQFMQHQTGTKTQHSDFDSMLAQAILRLIPMGLYEATNTDVWSYITLNVAPDVANWRYTNTTESTSYDRHLGTYRNVFRKIWIRQYFSGEAAEISADIGEDQSVAIFERTAVISNPAIASACVKALANVRELTKNNDVYRDAMIRVRRRLSISSLDLMHQNDLDELIEGLFMDSYSAITGIEPLSRNQ